MDLEIKSGKKNIIAELLDRLNAEFEATPSHFRI